MPKKTVIDFSNLSDSQILALFNKTAAGTGCGKFSTTQLDRVFQRQRKATLPSQIAGRIAAAFVFLQTLQISLPTLAAKPNMLQSPEVPVSSIRHNVAISGYVKDYITGEALKGISIALSGTKLQAETDDSGFFAVTLPEAIADTVITLTTSYTARSGAKPEGTIIPEEQIDLRKMAHATNVTLYRYANEYAKDEQIKYSHPLTERYGGYTLTYTPEKPYKKKWFHLFRKKKKGYYD